MKIMDLYKVFLCLCILCSLSSAADFEPIPGGMQPPRQQRDSRQPNEREQELIQQSQQAGQLMQEKLRTLLEHINSGGKLSQKDTQLVLDLVKENARYLPKMEPAGKCAYFLLSGWGNYFAGDYAKALQESMRAYKEDTQNADARGSVAAMSILNRDYKGLLIFKQEQAREIARLKAEHRKAMVESRKNGGGMPMQMPDMSTDYTPTVNSGTLKFSPEMIFADVIGKKIDPIKIKNINGAEIDFPQSDFIECVMVWKTIYGQAAQAVPQTAQEKPDNSIFGEHDSTSPQVPDNQMIPQGDIMMPMPAKDNTQQGSAGWSSLGTNDAEVEAFKKLFGQFMALENIKFSWANADEKPDKQKIIQQLMNAPGVWGQIILGMQQNKDIDQLGNIAIDNEMLLIIGKDGIIGYAGQIDNFVPTALMERLSGEDANITEVLADDASVYQPDSNAIAKNNDQSNENSPAPQEPQVSADPIIESKPIDETKQLTDDIEAQKLYEIAEISRKKGRNTSYNKMINVCREIIQKYPNTQYAPMAKDMLKRLPESQKRLHKVTDQELAD